MLHRTFAWQAGYAAFSVSESQLDNVTRYITNQQAHHQRVSFREELITFLNRAHIQYDERYIWK
jgi:REP-associated tyrosine transposase